jgi:methanogenic corrinoid protein MtbC1
MRKSLAEFPDDPVYNMKAVEQQTGISAATLRAWERRYALIEPKRTPSGYRLYSDRDVALLRWVRDRMAEGLTVSRVVAMLESIRTSDEPLWIEDQNGAGGTSNAITRETPLPPASLIQPLYSALIDLDDERADEVMEQAFAMYTMPTVYVDIIAPCLVEIGEAWHRGDIFISTEHFATTYLRGRLLGLLQAYPHRPDMPTLFVGCAPHERHEVGALIFAVMLRQQGYNVIYLGQDVPVEDVVQAVIAERPAMLCLSASNPTSAAALRTVQQQLERVSGLNTLFGYGGRAFDQDSELRGEVRGYYLGQDPRDAVNFINNLMKDRRLTS